MEYNKSNELGKQGVWIEYNSKGEVVDIDNYENDLLNGWSVTFRDKKIHRTTKWEKDKQIISLTGDNIVVGTIERYYGSILSVLGVEVD